MSEEFVPTGHHIFRGGKRIQNEVVEKEPKPFVVYQSGEGPEEKEAPAAGSAEEIAARIAGDRKQFQADILALAREKKKEQDTADA
ncbi:hypothetical protein [uncultured Selenomonas sp.]|uniref:hypothetical protein n=1 Tax=uncultured Selenomonas sp. TaxID=159275 RepID=UPI00280455E1|nr:hypothetical protein [uncultured Selenomonas sp.]